MCEAVAWLGRDVHHWAWQAFDERSLQLCVCVRACVRLKGAKTECLRMRVCAVDVAVCESKMGVHEVTSHQLFDFPSFPGKQLEEQCKETNNRRQ